MIATHSARSVVHFQLHIVQKEQYSIHHWQPPAHLTDELHRRGSTRKLNATLSRQRHTALGNGISHGKGPASIPNCRIYQKEWCGSEHSRYIQDSFWARNYSETRSRSALRSTKQISSVLKNPNSLD